MGIAIGEGFETCMAARQIGFRPVWALGSVGAIEDFPVLSGIECLTILGETTTPARRRSRLAASLGMGRSASS